MPLVLTQDRTIVTGDILTINTSGAGVSMSDGSAPSLYVYGSLIITSTTPETRIDGIFCTPNGIGANTTVANYGLIQVTASSTSLACGLNAQWGHSAIFNNTATGHFIVTGGGAVGIDTYDAERAIANAGEIRVTATSADGDAVGIQLTNISLLPISNSGTLTVHGVDAYSNYVVGIRTLDSGRQIANSGQITVSADSHPESTVGIYIEWPDNIAPTVIENSGTIAAGWAVWENGSFNTLPAATTFVNNSGTITGSISLGAGWDTLINTGSISGPCYLGSESDLYDGGRSLASTTVYGGAGDDKLMAGRFGDKLFGEAGNDIFVANAGNNTFDGGDGTDTIDMKIATAGVTANLALAGVQTFGGGLGTSTLSSVENITGSDYADILTGNGSDNRIIGGAGADQLNGGAGNDTLYGDWPGEIYIRSFDLVSSNAIGTVGNDRSSSAVISPDGTKVLFQSRATNLATLGAESYTIPFYLKDLTTDAISNLVFWPVPGTIDSSAKAVLSPDGTKAALGKYVVDLATGHSTVAVTASDGSDANGTSIITAISPDGTKILFESDATNLVAGDTNGMRDIFIKDLTTGTVRLVSTATDGHQADYTSDAAIFSPDGTKVVFESMATNFVAGDTSRIGGLFIKDLATGRLDRVCQSDWGGVYSFHFSTDGKTIVFSNSISGLPGANGKTQIYCYDLARGSTVCASTSASGQSANQICADAAISPDGRYVAFWSAATNLTASPSSSNIYVKDLVTGSVQALVLPYDLQCLEQGLHITAESDPLSFSADGKSLIIVAGPSGAYMQNVYVARLAQSGIGSDDSLSGGDGADTLIGGAGNDTVDGGSNVDTAVVSGNRAAYTVTQTSTGNFTVAGPDGTDTLTNVEYLKFDDQTMRLLPGTGTTIDWSADPSTFMSAIRDFDGNDLGAAADWKPIGIADVNGDGTAEHILVNRQNGRWAEVATEADGKTYFDNHGWAGDTRVVGIYIDPLVTSGEVVAGSDFDSQRRFQNDLNIENIHGVLGQGDYNHDGLQEIYFSLTDGTAYLHAYMHADGNIQYANYQNQQQVKDYLTANGFSSSTWAGWFPAAQTPLAAIAGA